MLLLNKCIMPPLWLAYPEIERYSIGWRMGYGEEYQNNFFAWWDSLSLPEQIEYQTLFPEPITWDGWWLDEHPDENLSYNDYWIPIWQQFGLPKYNLNQIQKEKQPELFFFETAMNKSCLNHWWLEDFSVSTQNYKCLEQFMMEQKAELFQETSIKQKILEVNSPEQIQALGKEIKAFDQIIWDKFKYAIALQGNWNKFNQKRILREFLLSTGDTLLVGASLNDSIWGIPLSMDSPDTQNLLKWQGQNLLGFALMEVRDELRRVWQNESLCDWSLVK